MAIDLETTKENHGNWKITYKPYSWELNADGKPYIAPKENIDISDTKLPVKTYVKTNLSFPGLQENIRRINEELGLIKSAKEEGIAIDISKRIGENPNAPLDEFLNKVSNSDKPLEEFKKLIIFPNGIRTFKQILSSLHNYAGGTPLNLSKSGLTEECKGQIKNLVNHLMK